MVVNNRATDNGHCLRCHSNIHGWIPPAPLCLAFRSFTVHCFPKNTLPRKEDSESTCSLNLLACNGLKAQVEVLQFKPDNSGIILTDLIFAHQNGVKNFLHWDKEHLNSSSNSTSTTLSSIASFPVHWKPEKGISLPRWHYKDLLTYKAEMKAITKQRRLIILRIVGESKDIMNVFLKHVSSFEDFILKARYRDAQEMHLYLNIHLFFMSQCTSVSTCLKTDWNWKWQET